MKPEPNRLTVTNDKPNGSMNWYVQAFQKYAEFNGRSRRSEFWYFTLVNALVIMGIILIELIFGTYGILGYVYAFGTIILGLALTIRRLHDRDRSGWFVLLGLIPLIGGVILLQNSQYGENQYGKWPKEGMKVR